LKTGEKINFLYHLFREFYELSKYKIIGFTLENFCLGEKANSFVLKNKHGIDQRLKGLIIAGALERI